MESLFAEISKAGTSPASNCVFNDVIILWRILLSLSAPNAASRSRLQSLLRQNVGHAASVALLDSFVFSAPNSRYRVPADAAVADTRECAIVEASDDRYWIAPRPFLGPAFFARLVALYAKADKDTSSKIGLAFEVHLLDRMAVHHCAATATGPFYQLFAHLTLGPANGCRRFAVRCRPSARGRSRSDSGACPIDSRSPLMPADRDHSVAWSTWQRSCC
jgi:hypothetical protein